MHGKGKHGTLVDVFLGCHCQEAVRLPPLESEDGQWGKRVAQLERHMRENKLRQHMTVTEELGKPQSEWDEVKSTKEAKRLAFDIFWNARSDYSR